MLIPPFDRVAGLDGDYRVRRVARDATSQRGRRNVLHGVVGVGGSETVERALVLPVDLDFLETRRNV